MINEDEDDNDNQIIEIVQGKNKIAHLIEDTHGEDSDYEEEFEVGKDKQFKTIQAAVEAAPTKTRIKIAKGIYRENILIIRKKDLILTSLDPRDPAILLSENSPCITIHCLDDPDVVKITNLKFIHRGMREDLAGNNQIASEFFAWHMSHLKSKESNFIYKNASEIEKLEVNYILDPKIIQNIYQENHGNFSAINVQRGTMSMNNCMISLAFLTTETRNLLPAIYVEGSTAIIENTFIKGNQDYLTVGIYSHTSQMKINECKIFKHRCGGIISVVDERNTVELTKCQLVSNSGCGAMIMSLVSKLALKEKAKGFKGALEINIEGNTFDSNFGNGLTLNRCFNASLVGNKFMRNLLHGAHLIDCDGFVMMNEYKKNKGTGLVIETKEEANEPKILKNIFNENYCNGIEIKGNNNKALITQNPSITNNYLNGIFISNLASPNVNQNCIFENNHHGILIESNSWATIRANKIYGNIRTNISFGGKLSENTKIIDNEIFNARNEGIFVIECPGGEIRSNKIHNNNEGIILVKCHNTYIHGNEIYKNMRTGVLLSDMSTPQFVRNNLYENNFIGMMIRDKSGGKIAENTFNQNVTQFYLSKNCIELREGILRDNSVEGRYDVADYCTIF